MLFDNRNIFIKNNFSNNLFAMFVCNDEIIVSDLEYGCLMQKFLLIFLKMAYYITYSDWLGATILAYVTTLFMTLIIL